MDTWITDDLSLATFLQLMGHTIQAMDWQGPACYFVFNKTGALMDDVADYAVNEANCDPKELLTAFKRLKKEMLDSRPSARNAS